MKLTLLAVGTIKPSYLKQGITNYVKRLQPYARLDIVEVAEEKAPDSLSPTQEEHVRQREGERILGRLPDRLPGTKIVVLDMRGCLFSSEQFAAQMAEWTTYGSNHFYFVIGGSLGLSRQVRERADLIWSFSKLTFPHQWMRLIVLEQLYRTFKIQRGDGKHVKL